MGSLRFSLSEMGDVSGFDLGQFWLNGVANGGLGPSPETGRGLFMVYPTVVRLLHATREILDGSKTRVAVALRKY